MRISGYRTLPLRKQLWFFFPTKASSLYFRLSRKAAVFLTGCSQNTVPIFLGTLDLLDSQGGLLLPLLLFVPIGHPVPGAE